MDIAAKRILVVLWIWCISAAAQAGPTSVEIVSGNRQAIGNSSEPRYAPLSVRVRDESGRPLSAIPVTFSAPLSGPGFTGVEPARLTVISDAQGIATLGGLSGNRADGFFNVVANTSPPVQSPALFLLSQAPNQFHFCILPSGPVPARVDLSVLPSPSTEGQEITLRANFTGTMVGFLDGDRVIANAVDRQQGGMVTHRVANLAPGAHILRAAVLPSCMVSPDAVASLAHDVTTTNKPALNYSDMWWNSSESGWGLSFIQHASGQAFAVWFTYREDQSPQWFAIPGGVWTRPATFSGVIHRTTGPAWNLRFDPSAVASTPVGTAMFEFVDSTSGSFTYSIGDESGRKHITRQPF